MNRHSVLLLGTELRTSTGRSLPVIFAHTSLVSPLVVPQQSGWHPPTMIRCMMAAFEYFDGLPQAALTDRMKSVFLDMDGNTPIWNPIFADFAACLGVAPRVCKARKPQTKGKVERSVGVIKDGF